jgi:hypothetical protein
MFYYNLVVHNFEDSEIVQKYVVKKFYLKPRLFKISSLKLWRIFHYTRVNLKCITICKLQQVNKPTMWLNILNS